MTSCFSDFFDNEAALLVLIIGIILILFVAGN